MCYYVTFTLLFVASSVYVVLSLVCVYCTSVHQTVDQSILPHPHLVDKQHIYLTGFL